MKTRTPKLPPPLQTAKPLDYLTSPRLVQYVQQDKHIGARLFADADGSWMVVPTVRVYSAADCDAEKLARAFFNSLRDEPLDETDRFDGGKSQSYEFPKRQSNHSGAQGTRKDTPNAASGTPGEGGTRGDALDTELNR